MKNISKVWVDVFDCVLGEKRNQYDFTPEIPDYIKDVMDKIQSFGDSFSGENMDEILEGEMGTPIEVTTYTEGNLNFTKKVWEIDDKRIVKITADIPEGIDYEDLSLEEKLKIAIQNEDYEKAAELRDEIENSQFMGSVDGSDEKKVEKLLKNFKNKKSDNQEDKE